MNNQIQSQNSSQSRGPDRGPLPLENMHSNKKVWLVAIAAAVLVILIGGYFTWANYFSPDAQRRINLEKNYEKATAAMNAFEKAMREDTYGGKTPQETLDMFIDALKKGDIELASKYFMLDTNSQSPDYLTRRKWEEGLAQVSKDGKLFSIVSTIENLATSTKRNLGSSDVFEFVIYDENGIAINSIDLRLNKYSLVWKIESM